VAARSTTTTPGAQHDHQSIIHQGGDLLPDFERQDRPPKKEKGPFLCFRDAPQMSTEQYRHSKLSPAEKRLGASIGGLTGWVNTKDRAA
jgi:hypothetical protein